MQTENRFFDDLAKVLNGAAGTLAGMGREAEANFREQVRNWAGSADSVSREEFDAVKAMAAKARAEVEALRARLDAMDAGRKDQAGVTVKASPKATRARHPEEPAPKP